MTKTQATEIIDFIRRHYDMVGQEDWFALCDMLLDVIVHDANAGRYAQSLAKKYPDFFNLQ